MKRGFEWLFLCLLPVIVLSACNNSEDAEQEAEEAGVDEGSVSTDESGELDNIYNYEDFPQSVSNNSGSTGEGVMNIGYSMDTPFEGTFNWAFYSLGPDADIMEFFDESVFTFNENREATNEGAIEYEMDEENNTVTFTVKEGVTWHDGEPLKIQDYIMSYEVIGHPDYEGVRGNTDGFTLIEGYNDYKAGDSEEISGIEITDDRTAVFTYTELSPSLTSGGFWFYAMPEHHYEGTPVAEMAAAPQTRDNPIGIGPYKVDSIVSGESVTFSKFEDYWRGEPQLDGIELNVTPTSSIANAMESGDIDLAMNFPAVQYPDVADMEGVEWLAEVEPIYDYIGFKQGTWDEENGRVDYRPEEMKMGDEELRRAMWYALDNDAVGERFYNGLRWKATTLIPPSHADYHNSDIEVPEYDPEESNRILDEAGYLDIDDDGFRETPEGEPLEINFGSMAGGETAEPLANYYIQSWRAVGLNVVKTNGRLIEYNTFYDMLGKDDPEIDIFLAGWSVGTDVDQTALYGHDAPYNYIRYETEENTTLLEKGNSLEALDIEVRIEAYNEWQELMVDEVSVIPTLYRAGLYPVSENIVNYSVEYGFDEDTHLYNLGFSE